MSEITAKRSRTNMAARTITGIGVLSAAAFVLQMIEISVPIMPSFLKFDFSDLPALIGSFTLGPVSGILIELVKNILHTFDSGSFGVGELSNFLLGAVFVGIAGLVYKLKRSKKGALTGALAGAAAMAVMSVPFNYFVVYPVYYNFMPEETILGMYQAILPSVKSILHSLLVFNMPFTFVKGIVNVVITFLIYKRISPILKGTNY
ncbi:MAG: ECF transporter S component [Blautia sp.]|nr:ECF transporter S component [Blautia sp.]